MDIQIVNGYLAGPMAGFVVVLICLFGSAAIIVCNKYIKKVTNTYWFWLGLSIVILAYFISCRFALAWKNYAHALSTGLMPDGSKFLGGSTYDGANLISRALLFDFCPFFGLLTPILLIVDPTRKAARSVTPILLFGTLFTCTAGFLTTGPEHMSLDPYIFFHGDKDWELYIGLHITNLWLATGILCNTPKFEFEGYLIMLGCVFLFIVYVLVGKAITGCQMSTSGLSFNDWWYLPNTPENNNGTYYPITKVFAAMFGMDPLKDKRAALISMGIIWPLELAAFSSVVALWDKGFKHFKWHQYGNARSKCWWQWYDYNKFVKPWRFPWKPLNTVSLFWAGELKKKK